MSKSQIPGLRGDCAAVLGIALLSTAVAVLALTTARGVVRQDAITYTTEFISGWWWLVFLLTPLPAALVHRRIATATVAAVALVLPQFVAAAVCVARYRASGWSDGLEGLSYLHPLLLLLATGAACGRTAVAGRRT
ncbi:membrane protein of unknown function [Modestobacter italicus]|uniref:Integral membrane protein n=1 Tax=Modestobacter italicus (strain DSM 44449 / CECT 9708 / BC 501) TaxID=2732864 RepID=I4F3C0_MODI5|nr:hypothetical protein [Modestobacter marinus]CCH90133.1 membrane protein of unknown function [Modestobacter marinus]